MIELVVKREMNLKNELLSGLTVALALVPEAVAFAFVAGVDPSVGLWAAFFVGFITSLAGGRPGMISGATGAMAVVMTSFVILYGIEYLFAAVILCGVIQMLCGAIKVGRFVRLLPHPVMLGFVNGLAIVIGMAQFGQLKEGHHVVFVEATQTFAVAAEWMGGTAMMTTVGLIALTMAIIHFLPKLTKAVPGTLVAIVAVTMLVRYTPLESVTVADSVHVQKAAAADKKQKSDFYDIVKQKTPFDALYARGHEVAAADSIVLPSAQAADDTTASAERQAGAFAIPSIPLTFHSLAIIIGLSMTLAAIGLIESLMTLTLIDELTGTRGKSNRECVAQGAANVVCGFFGAMGGCAMIGQSMINIRSGGRHRLSGITAAVCLLAFILIPQLWACIEMIPVAALIGVMFIVVIATFEWTSLRLLNRIPHSDFVTILAVSSITVMFDLAIAVAAGVIISALVFAWKKSQALQATVSEDMGVKVYALHGPLFFGSVTSFKELFAIEEDSDEIHIEFKDCHVYDHSAVEAINGLCEKYRVQGKTVTLKHLSKDCQAMLKKAEAIIEVTIEDPSYNVTGSFKKVDVGTADS